MSITNAIDTDKLVLSYVEPSILAYMKTINSIFDILKWMLDNNFPKDGNTFTNAALNGNFDIL